MVISFKYMFAFALRFLYYNPGVPLEPNQISRDYIPSSYNPCRCSHGGAGTRKQRSENGIAWDLMISLMDKSFLVSRPSGESHITCSSWLESIKRFLQYIGSTNRKLRGAWTLWRSQTLCPSRRRDNFYFHRYQPTTDCPHLRSVLLHATILTTRYKIRITERS